MLFIFEDYNDKNKAIYKANTTGNDTVMVLNDDGFLDDEVISPYYFFTNKLTKKEKKYLFANSLEVKEFYEIIMFFDHGEIWDDGKLLGIVDYIEPKRYQNVKSVTWLKENKAFRIDHYDMYGNLYFSDELNSKEEVLVRTYYLDGKPILTYLPVFKSFTVLKGGDVFKMFEKRSDLLRVLIKRYYPKQKIMTNSEEIKKELAGCGFDVIIGKRFEKEFKENSHNKEILILTNSDVIEHLNDLIKSLPDYNFHICSITLMSDKITGLSEYKNVYLYPGLTVETKEKLYNFCSYYLDINHYNEIEDAVYEAYKNNLLILSFKETVHNVDYVLNECLFNSEDFNSLIKLLKETESSDTLDLLLEKQNNIVKGENA